MSFRSIINLESFSGRAQPCESKQLSLKYTTQCIRFDRCKLKISISDLNRPSLKWIPTSFKDTDERICWGLYLMLRYFPKRNIE